MERQDILKQIVCVIKGVMPDCCHDFSKINEQTRFIDDLDFDSIAYLMMGSSLEEQFDVHTDDASINKFKTVKDVIDFIELNISK